MKEYLPQIESIVAPIVESRGYELVEIKVAGVGRASVLRVFVYRVGGITIDEITTLSRVISEELDKADIIPHSYMLEVSSPGLDRPLKSISDFRRAQTERVRVTLNDGTSVEGVLSHVDSEGIVLDTKKGERIIPISEIQVGKIII